MTSRPGRLVVDETARNEAEAHDGRRRHHPWTPVSAAASRSSRAIIGSKSRSFRNAAAAASRSSTGASGGASTWSATSRNAASGARPISSDSWSSTPSSAASARTVSQTRQRGVTPEVEEVHRDLGPGFERIAALRLRDREPVGLDLGQPAAGLPDPAGDPLRELDVVGVEVDVPGDEERPGADGDRPGRRMHPGRPEVRLAAVLGDLGLQALVLAATDVGELHPIGPPRRPGVEVDRQVEALGDAGAEAPGELDRLVHRRVPERDERDDVDRADPGVLARVLVHVDVADGGRDERLEGGRDRARRTRDREDGAVVAGVARPVEEVDAGHRRHRAREPVDDVEPTPFGDVRDRFDQAVGQVVRERAHRGHRATPPRAARPRRCGRGQADRMWSMTKRANGC